MTFADAVSDLFDGVRDESATLEDDERRPSALSTDDVFHILQTKRRRDVLRYLQGTDGPVRMRALAEQVAAWEHDTTVDALTSNERQRVYISLYQSHLPKLDEERIIRYDKDRGIVERTALAERFDPYIDEVAGTDDQADPWPRRYAGTVLVGAVVLGTVATDLTSMPGLVAGTFVLLAFAVLTAAHLTMG
jgi:hypothetical protein